MAPMSKSIPLRVPDGLLELIDLYTKEQRSDRVTTLRVWLNRGAEEYALRLVSEGRLSRGRAVELPDITYYDIYDLAQKYGIEIGPTGEQSQQAMENARLLLRASRRRPKPEDAVPESEGDAS